ncbi:MAG: hypothetical protein J0M24_27890, partial [Verrucomicrobia bacterium]|nr:hypothetical protein [Verrucomicrobiota bacterium]
MAPPAVGGYAPPVGRRSAEPFASQRMTRQESTRARLGGTSPYQSHRSRQGDEALTFPGLL